MTKTKAIITTAVVLLFLFGLGIWSLAAPDEAVSRAERRKLAQAPDFTLERFFDAKYAPELETYLLDQFPERDGWRTLQARFRFDVLRQSDSNGVYLRGGSVSKLEYPLKDKQVRHALKKFYEVKETCLQGSQVRLAVIPDKNFFLAGDYPHLDYDRLFTMIDQAGIAERIDLTPHLTAEDYYRTDSHWRQESILPVAQAAADSFGLGVDLTPEGGFTPQALTPFYGVYCGQSALDVTPDTITCLTSPATEAAVMTGPELKGEQPVYTLDRFSGMDAYDIFCAGPQAVLTIESPLAKTDRELILFRDSFGSSLAPLFLEGYRRVTLVDLRYIAASILDQYVDFHGQDALFLYSASLLNSGMLLK